MPDPRPNIAFVEALLAQEQTVSAAQYADYRRQLERRLADEARRLRSARGRRRTGIALLLATAAVVAAILVLRPGVAERTKETPPDLERTELVVLRPALAGVACGPQLPFALENSADVIAVAALGEPCAHRGEPLRRLDVERCLKGELGEKAVAAPQPGLGFTCGLPLTVVPAGADRKGARVLLYLQGSKRDGWGILEIQRLLALDEGRKVAEIERFLDVRRAAASADPKTAYDRCLDPARGGVDPPALCALTCQPDARAADVLLENLARTRDALRQEVAAKPRKVSSAREEMLAGLAELLARLHEARALPALLECTPHLSTAGRARLYTALPALCQAADRKGIAAARKALIQAIQAAPRSAGDYESAVAALGKLADEAALEVLLREQARRPHDTANGHALAAVRRVAAALGGRDRDRAHEAWIALLCAYAPPEKPTAGERQFIHSLLSALEPAGLTPAQRDQLRAVRGRAAAPWFRAELDRVAGK